MAGEKPKKSIGGMLKGIFIDDSNDDTVPETETKVEQKAAATTAINTISTPQVEINKDIVNSLKKAVEDANLEGYDYYEFMKAIETIDMPSEQQKFKVAYSVIINLPGMSVDYLIKTADHYSEALVKHKKEFATKFDTAVKCNITDIEAVIAETDNEVNGLNEQIAAAQKKITDLVNKRTELNNQVQNNRIELERQKTEYNLAYGIFETSIVDNKKKIEKYLKEK